MRRLCVVCIKQRNIKSKHKNIGITLALGYNNNLYFTTLCASRFIGQRLRPGESSLGSSHICSAKLLAETTKDGAAAKSLKLRLPRLECSFIAISTLPSAKNVIHSLNNSKIHTSNSLSCLLGLFDDTAVTSRAAKEAFANVFTS